MQVGSSTRRARFLHMGDAGGAVKRARKLKLALLGMNATIALAASSALAQTDAPAPPIAAPAIVPADTAVAAFYDGHLAQPIWFRGGVDNPALTQLVTILQRAPFDGFAEGPQLAAQAQAAIAQARSGNPAESAAAERTLSIAWVEYVQAI